jgi:hypothetical protein
VKGDRFCTDHRSAIKSVAWLLQKDIAEWPLSYGAYSKAACRFTTKPDHSSVPFSADIYTEADARSYRLIDVSNAFRHELTGTGALDFAL